MSRKTWTGFVFAVVGQRKGAEVAGDAHARSQSEVRLHRFPRRHVDLTHEPLGTIGSDRKNREIDLGKVLRDLCDVRARTRITGKVDARVIGLHHKAAPQASCRDRNGERPEKCCAGTAVIHISLRAAASCHQSNSTTFPNSVPGEQAPHSSARYRSWDDARLPVAAASEGPCDRNDRG